MGSVSPLRTDATPSTASAKARAEYETIMETTISESEWERGEARLFEFFKIAQEWAQNPKP